MNKIQKEKLLNDENAFWDEEYSDNSEITISSPKSYNQYSQVIGNVKNNLKIEKKLMKRKVAKITANKLDKDHMNQKRCVSENSLQHDIQLNDSFDQISLEDNFDRNEKFNKLTSCSKTSTSNDFQLKSCNSIL